MWKLHASDSRSAVNEIDKVVCDIQQWKIEVSKIACSDSRSAVIEINKVVYEIEIDKVVYKIAKCENCVLQIPDAQWSQYLCEIQKWKTDVYKIACLRLQKRNDQK